MNTFVRLLSLIVCLAVIAVSSWAGWKYGIQPYYQRQITSATAAQQAADTAQQQGLISSVVSTEQSTYATQLAAVKAEQESVLNTKIASTIAEQTSLAAAKLSSAIAAQQQADLAKEKADIAAAIAAIPPPTPVAPTSAYGMIKFKGPGVDSLNVCVNADAAFGNAVPQGRKIQFWNCDNKDPNQRYLLTQDGHVQWADSDLKNPLCIDAVGGSTANGTKLQLFQCNDSNKGWQFANGTLKWNNKCLDIPSGNFTVPPGDTRFAQIWDCNGSAAQQVTFPVAGV